MTLISSISGTRGTIGGAPGTNLTPADAVAFTAAYALLLKQSNPTSGLPTVVVGRDARPSGLWLNQVVCGTLQAAGINVIDLGLSTTPTVEMAVPALKASGGIILTASHNPVDWNALKLLNHRGEFISSAEGQKLLEFASSGKLHFEPVAGCGSYHNDSSWIDFHIDAVVSHPLVDVAAIKAAQMSVAIDPVNSSGAIAMPKLLEKLGVKTVVGINMEATGWFAHNPEPLREHLVEISRVVVNNKCHLGIVVDPDVDRLAFVMEDGDMFGEEYTLVAVADYVLAHRSGGAVSNLSSSRALRDVCLAHNRTYTASAVGEVNVVEAMKATGAAIGGEGNGGIIFPELHYGRDALIGIGLFLTHLAKSGKTISELRRKYTHYEMAKNKAELAPHINPDKVLAAMAATYKNEKINTVDGLKIDFERAWVHLRKSNTEPILRIYTEAATVHEAQALAARFQSELLETSSKI